MSLLIDGYNLLNAAGIVGRGSGPGGLERSRRALLNFIVESIPPAEIPRATVVFDAAQRMPGLPRSLDHRGLTVLFAAEYEDADALIEELIKADSAPRRLTVVSSDHRVQRAARRRGATAVDSERWHSEVLADRRRRNHPQSPTLPKPGGEPTAEDLEFWLREFGGGVLEESAALDDQPIAPAEQRPAADAGEPAADDAGPFPDEYLQDVERLWRDADHEDPSL